MKRVIACWFLISGSVTLALLILFLVGHSDIGGGAGFEAGVIALLLLGTASAFLAIGALLDGNWAVVLGETWVVVGAFLLGMAARSVSPEGEALGIAGLCVFLVGYLIVRRAADVRRASQGLSTQVREETLRRMLEDSRRSENWLSRGGKQVNGTPVVLGGLLGGSK